MHIDIVPNRDSPPTVLLRESYREGKKVKKRTLANLSSLSGGQVEAIRAILRGEAWRPVTEAFAVTRSQAHGAVQAVRLACERLGMASLLGSRPSGERDLVLAMIAARILNPQTKMATTRWWQTTTLADDCGVTEATEDDLYAAMDWLLARQDKIQKKLAARPLTEGGLVLYALSSSYFEGTTCPLAKLGYSRDGKKGLLQVNYGVLTDGRGCPVAVSVFEGNTADPATLLPAVHTLREDFGIERLVLVGDRGMISSQAITTLREQTGIDWITALKHVSIRGLVEQKGLQLDLFDERNLFELTHPDYPGERLVACRNQELAKRRTHKREALLQATETALTKIAERVQKGRLTGRDEIGLKVGRMINQYKMAKHFTLTMEDTVFSFARKRDAIAAEAALDGIYVIRTSVDETRMSAADCVRYYKSLAQVERAFRSLKTIDLKVRPIHHRLADRVRAHLFLCVLAYYVEWHLREAWRPSPCGAHRVMFADEDQEAKTTRDPVAPAKRSAKAERKVATKTQDDGTPLQSFQTLLASLSTIVRNTCRTPGTDPDAATFTVTTTPSPQQQRAFELIQQLAL